MNPKDKKTERIIYVVLIVLILLAILLAYKMSQDFGGN